MKSFSLLAASTPQFADLLGLPWVAAILLLVLLIGFWVSLAFEKQPIGLVLLLLAAVVLYTGKWIDPASGNLSFSSVRGVMGLIGYFILCLAWTTFVYKWDYRKKIRKTEDSIRTWLRENGATTTGLNVPPELHVRFKQWRDGSGKANFHDRTVRDELYNLVWIFLYTPLHIPFYIADTFFKEFFIWLLELNPVRWMFDWLSDIHYAPINGQLAVWQAEREVAEL